MTSSEVLFNDDVTETDSPLEEEQRMGHLKDVALLAGESALMPDEAWRLDEMFIRNI